MSPRKTLRERVLFFALKYGLICDDIEGDVAVLVPISNREEVMRDVSRKKLRYQRVSEKPEKIRFLDTKAEKITPSELRSYETN